jgi:hypothetical protein
VFWVGEGATPDSGGISNAASAWDGHWEDHFGGVDDPQHRSGWDPVGFLPRENPFYVALPYNDLDGDGNPKPSAKGIPWAGEPHRAGGSICKNRWVRIVRDGRVVYAQWEDVGPFNDDDFNYVFGTGAPASQANDSAGIDVSPAVRDYLGLGGLDGVDWQFVDTRDVPPGPWRDVVTASGDRR